jgi:hypothetical protein
LRGWHGDHGDAPNARRRTAGDDQDIFDAHQVYSAWRGTKRKKAAANSSLDEIMNLKPNDLMQWRGIQWTCAQGLRRHSLGGAHEFLLRFGGAVVPIVRYRTDRTLFLRHDLKEGLDPTGRFLLRHAASGIDQTVRKRLGKTTGKAH